MAGRKRPDSAKHTLRRVSAKKAGVKMGCKVSRKSYARDEHRHAPADNGKARRT